MRKKPPQTRDPRTSPVRTRRMPPRRRPRRVYAALGVVGLALCATVTIAAISPQRGSPVNLFDGITATPDLPLTPPNQTVTFAGTVHSRSGPAESDAISHSAADSTQQAEDDTAHAPDAAPHITVTIRAGDTLGAIFARLGLKPQEVGAVIDLPAARVLAHLTPGRSIRIHTGAGGRLAELRYELDAGSALHVKRTDTGLQAAIESRDLETRTRYVAGGIESSLFDAGQQAGLADAQILKLVEIFGWDIDFALDLRKGDGFAVIYEEQYWHGAKVADGGILAAEFVNQDKVYRAIRHQARDGEVSYYSPEGLSLRRAFLRTPVKFSRISSRFSTARLHPVLGSWRAHRGVDYAAAPGTPVLATADGRVSLAGGHGGYGNAVVIRHGGAYSTLYAHLSRFEHGIRTGSAVKQGQIVGYVGRTGLATGPHLHYEFQVGGAHVDPLKFKQPATEPINPAQRDEFLRQARHWLARLDQLGRTTLALNAGDR